MSRGPEEDGVVQSIVEYVLSDQPFSQEAYETARWDLMDALGSGILALSFPQCTKLLGPVVPGMSIALGARVPGTSWELDPVQAAFCLGTMIRWLDYNDTWLAAEWGHPSDNLGAILPVAEWVSRERMQRGARPWRMRDVLTAMIKAHEIQGVLSLETSLNRVGLDHVLFVKVASAAVSAWLMGLDRNQLASAITNAWIDGAPLRTYRHAPNTGSRKSWAAGDAGSRGVRLALMAERGEMGYPGALTTPTWGFQDALMGGREVTLAQHLGCYVMENVLFKVNYPAEFHGQTAVEAAIKLWPEVHGRWDAIDTIIVSTQESARRIIDKNGPLSNPADRDYCLQYMVAVALHEGNLTAAHYENSFAVQPWIDALREKMVVVEDPAYSRDYLDPEKRSIANAVEVRFQDGSSTGKVEVCYPVGHRRRRQEALPLLKEKFLRNVNIGLTGAWADELLSLFQDQDRLEGMAVPDFVQCWLS